MVAGARPRLTDVPSQERSQQPDEDQRRSVCVAKGRAPETFVGLFRGDNIGKMLIDLRLTAPAAVDDLWNRRFLRPVRPRRS